MWAQDSDLLDREGLPTLETLSRPPSYEELMENERFDWVVLKLRDFVLECRLVDGPRPNTYRRLVEERDILNALPRRTSEENLRFEQVKLLALTFRDGTDVDRKIKLDQVADIIGSEQLMLERIDLLLDEGDTDKAYDMLQRLDADVPDWEETAPRLNRLLFLELQSHIKEGRPVAAMALTDQIYDRDPTYPKLSELMGTLLDPMISKAVSDSDFRRARWLLRRLTSRFSDHEVVGRWRKQLQELADAKLSEAAGHANKADHQTASQLARESGLIWPSTGADRRTREELMLRYQVVRVAVDSIADSAFPVLSPSQRRDQELVSVPVFKADVVGEITHFRSPVVEEWDPQDLGRVVTFSLRGSRPYWQSQVLVSAGQVAATLAEKLDPKSDEYDPRLASFVSGYTVRSPTKIEVRFSRVPLNLAALFRFSVQSVSSEQAGSETVSPTRLAGRFRLKKRSDFGRSYLRTIPEPDDLEPGQYHVAEIVEQVFGTRQEQIQAFRRNQIDVLSSLQPWEVNPVRESGLGFVQKLAMPANHVIVFNPESQKIVNAQLRRALSFAVPRDVILKKIILRDSSTEYGRPSSATWSQNSYASNPLIRPPQFNLRLAFMLKFAAEEQLRIPVRQKMVAQARAVFDATQTGNQVWNEAAWRVDHAEELQDAVQDIKLPSLVMLCESDPVMRTAAEEMIELWRRIGLDVQLIVAGESRTISPDWDMLYRRVSMEEPLFDLWSVLLTDNTLDVNLLRGYPDWLRRDLTRLDYAGSFRTARQGLFRIQRNIAAQAFLIPLWEVDQFVAFRSSVTGYRDRPISVYDNVERWVVKP
ncbi:MAG: ABC transporter substrate-binding protein [Fuerstiella sp.]|nr:ABC transporter substrate-binding protein [Fuerstiella sp.]